MFELLLAIVIGIPVGLCLTCIVIGLLARVAWWWDNT
jgi:hypothetical protein